jgi:hypothetical protein
MPSFKRWKTIRRSDAEPGVNLCKRRRWYSGDDAGDDPQEQDGPGAQTGDDFDLETLPEPVRLHILKLRSEAKGYRLDKRKLKEEIAAIEEKMLSREEARKAELERKGEFEALSRKQELELAELRVKAERADRLEQATIARNEEMLKKLPEHMRDLFPEGLSPEAQSAWLDTAVPKLTAPTIPDLDGGAGGQGRGAGGGSGTKLTPDEKKMAAAMGMTEEEYVAKK